MKELIISETEFYPFFYLNKKEDFSPEFWEDEIYIKLPNKLAEKLLRLNKLEEAIHPFLERKYEKVKK